MANLHNPVPTTPGRGADGSVASIAREVAALEPKSVAVIGDDASLTAALLGAGLAAAPAEQATPITAELAVVCCAGASADQVFPALREGVSRLLLVSDDGDALADWITVAAGRGYFRCTEQPRTLATDAVLLEFGEPTLAELVARYERLVTAVPTLVSRLQDLRHELLTAQDHAIGCEGEIGQLRAKNAAQEQQITEMYDSTTWHVGTKVISGAARVKRAIKR